MLSGRGIRVHCDIGSSFEGNADVRIFSPEKEKSPPQNSSNLSTNRLLSEDTSGPFFGLSEAGQLGNCGLDVGENQE